jgi:hypothetical protein
VPDSGNDNPYTRYASDIVSITFGAILHDHQERFEGKEFFMIYPSDSGQKIVLRNLNSNRKEYLPIYHLSPYITFEIQDHPEESADYILYK